MNQLDDMDVEELLRVNIRLTQENNKLLKKMRRDARFSFWMRILFFLVISGSAYYAYHFYLEDYLNQIIEMYNNLQKGVDTVKAIPTKFGL